MGPLESLRHQEASPPRSYNALIEVFECTRDVETPIYYNHIKIEVCEPFRRS